MLLNIGIAVVFFNLGVVVLSIFNVRRSGKADCATCELEELFAQACKDRDAWRGDYVEALRRLNALAPVDDQAVVEGMR